MSFDEICYCNVKKNCIRFPVLTLLLLYHLLHSAKKAGILIMNEVGLDPGIDHMSAMKIIDEAKAAGKKVGII